ncbi:MAG TPA: SCP2 sterol-binding domain-containing protein [Actinomycetota bacterium]
MAIKFLSDEWLSEVESRLNGHEGFQAAAKGQAARLQQQVNGSPDGDVQYGFVLADGKVQLIRGEIDDPEATITQDYDTAVALSKAELNGQAAFMSGKLKIGGNLMKMMTLQGVLAQMPVALGGMDVDY